MANKRLGRLPTVPEYYHDYINSHVNLSEHPKQCCPFHNEDTPSFSWSAEKGVWHCFGACKCGGDVIDLHRKNNPGAFSSRAEAEASLNRLYGVVKKVEVRPSNVNAFVREEVVDGQSLYLRALMMAKTVDRQLELDYFMSKTPVDLTELKFLIEEWQSVGKNEV